MTALMSKTLEQKEDIIKALENELHKEQSRRNEMSKNYKI